MLKILKNKKANSKRWNSENVLYFKKFKNFPEFSDKIYNPDNKVPENFLDFFDKFG